MKTKTASRTTVAKVLKGDLLPDEQPMVTELYRRAQARLRKQRKRRRPETGASKSAADQRRTFQARQVRQIDDLELRNAELQNDRDRIEPLLEKYTDLYDFAPVGYFSLDESGRIMEANLTGAALLGVERARLIHRPLQRFVAPASRPGFLTFLKRAFAETGKQVCEASLLRAGAGAFWAGFHGLAANTDERGSRKWCRVAVSDITSIKQAEEAQRRAEVLADANLGLRREIIRREKVEASLKQSERHQRQMLEAAHRMQEKLRQLSRQVLLAQEEERKRISRELHDVIAQTLTGINLRLGFLKNEAERDLKGFDRSVARTQRLVEKSVDIVHRFARELRPAVLDDLGLIPALHTFMKSFSLRTGVRTDLKAFAGVERMDATRRTVFYRVAQEALTNVARHAKASRAEVILQKESNGVCMTIQDDGKSFQVERILRRKGGEHLGLLGMRERVEMVGGCLHIESAPGRGTTIRAGIPFAASGRRGKAGKLPPSAKFICDLELCPNRPANVPPLKSAGIKPARP